jgi:hypothetical protein
MPKTVCRAHALKRKRSFHNGDRGGLIPRVDRVVFVAFAYATKPKYKIQSHKLLQYPAYHDPVIHYLVPINWTITYAVI